MRKALLSLGVVALLGGSLQAEVTNRVIARVNDRILTLYDYELQLEDAMRRVEDVPQDEQSKRDKRREVAEGVMRALWDELLILSRADQKGWTVTEEELQKSVDRMKKANGITEDRDLAQGLAEAGLTIEKWKAQIEKQLLYRQVVGREVFSQIEVEEEDLRRYYRAHPDEFRIPEQVKVQEIVVLEREDQAALSALAERVISELRDGESLEAIASNHENEQISKVIDLGWVAKEDLDQKIAAALDELEPGDHSPPIAGRGGLHIALLLDRKESVILPFKEIQEDLETRKRNERLEEKQTEYLVDLEKKAYIELNPPPDAAGFRTSSGATPIEVGFPLLEQFDDESGSGDSSD